jgi:hypothetical protein
MARSRIFALSLSTFALVTVACSSDDAGGATAQIRDFCARYVASPAFSCCSADDRNNASFRLRYHFGSQAECVDVLSAEAAQANGREGFDGTAAQSCLDYLNTRPCGTIPLANVKLEEQKAGCAKVLSGIQDENQSCNASSECKPGLVCPPIKETGLSFCAKPAGFNQDCIGEQAGSVDHPACQEGLFCQFIGENPAGCPSPPCLQFKCVPPFEEGEPCGGTECAQGLVCKDGTCQKGQLANAGESCRVPEHCAEGLYCDTAAGTCAPRKADGSPCTESLNPLFECKGICGAGTCASFCGQ